MKTTEPRTIYLKDYRPAPYLIDEAALDISLQPSATEVAARLSMRPNPAAAGGRQPLTLDGEKLRLVRVAIDSAELPAGAYEAGEKGLVIANPPAKPFTLEFTTICDPEANKALSGLYRSGTLYCTQCEPEGFRRITYYLDRPDVLAKFRVRLEAQRQGRAGAAVQRQSGGGRQAARRAPLRRLGRSVSQAVLSFRAGRRQAGPH